MLLQAVNFTGYRQIRRTLSRQIKLYWSLTFVILQELELIINSLESKQSETTEKNDININEVGKQTTCINPLSANNHTQILHTDVHAFP